MKILQNQMKQASFVRNRWAVVAAVGTDPNTLLDAETYAHIASMLRGGDIIEVVVSILVWGIRARHESHFDRVGIKVDTTVHYVSLETVVDYVSHDGYSLP